MNRADRGLRYPAAEVARCGRRPRLDWPSFGGVAEWLGRGLQSLAHRFDSGPRLEPSTMWDSGA
jgi:hypothetical protein